jgi:hypothetical protein
LEVPSDAPLFEITWPPIGSVEFAIFNRKIFEEMSLSRRTSLTVLLFAEWVSCSSQQQCRLGAVTDIAAHLACKRAVRYDWMTRYLDNLPVSPNPSCCFGNRLRDGTKARKCRPFLIVLR